MQRIKHIILLFFIIPLSGLAQGDSVYIKRIGKSEMIYQYFSKKTKKPIVVPEYSYGLYVSAIVSKFSAPGITEMSFLDTLGNPTYDSDSIYVYKMKTDPKETYSETRYYYLNNVEARPGDYWLHDKKGRELESGQIRMNDTAKINFWKTSYDKKGKILSEIYYTKRDSIGEGHDYDYSIVRYYYDNRGNFTGYAHRDHQGKLAAYRNDPALVVYSYNKKDKIISAEWFDQDSLATDNNSYNSYYSKIVFQYDRKNRISEISLITPESKLGYGTIGDHYLPNLYKEGRYSRDSYQSFSRKMYTYNAFGKIVREEYFDQYAQSTAYIQYRYFLWFFRGLSHRPD